ncbi:MAG: ArsA family ATPase [Myxococcales bacterium]|nr:ArsA family ATPase [Myxococcota bacterium]MDW8282364.1 ArsA family ATPase [Myxococcales bacterium]
MQSHRPPPSLLTRRLIVVVGKGGVGRTVVSCALALLAARSGRRVLLAQTKSKDRLGQLFGVRRSFQEIQPVLDNLWAVNMTPEAALREYGIMVLRSAFIYRQVFERDIVRAFLRAIPGLLDYSMLGKVWYHTTEEIGGRPRFDLVIMDAPATGHSVTLLRIPEVILDTVPEGPLTGPARACHELLTDPARCQMFPVTLAEDLPVTETIQLYGLLRNHGFPVGPVVVNRLYPPRFGAGVSALALDALERASDLGPLEPLVQSARLLRQRAALNEQHLRRLEAALPLRQIHLPYLFVPEFGFEAIEELGRRLEGQVEDPPT